jgi:hypothetical protein
MSYQRITPKNFAPRSPLESKAHNARIVAAGQAVKQALKIGTLTRLVCEACGEPETQAHHEDYTKQLDVKWLCVPCHMQRHNEIRIAGESVEGVSKPNVPTITADPFNRLIGTVEISTRLGYHKRWVNHCKERVNKGIYDKSMLPPLIKVGTRYFCFERDLEEWIRSKRVN